MIILPAERRIDWKRAPIALLGIVLLNIDLVALDLSE